MSEPTPQELEALWARHDAEWREPAQIASMWSEAQTTDANLLRHRASRAFWDLLGSRKISLLVTREYEHLVMCLGTRDRGPRVSFMRVPHPSGIAVDAASDVVHLASTRNPNQVFTLAPVTGALDRSDVRIDPPLGRPLVPIGSRFYPGSLYIHDIAMVGGQLHANAVGHNSIVRLPVSGGYEPAWWPKAIERDGHPDFSRNYLQLNSIAAGADLPSSFFSASAERPSARRPGHRNFAVDRRGVIFSGATREPVARGLTRPHSARMHEGRVWVDNSGYGEFGVVAEGRFEPVARLPGWTRGLAMHGDLAFVGTSRVIPRFRHYAPGLDVEKSVCGVHAIDVRAGELIGSLTWPFGNQIFAVEKVLSSLTTGFPFDASDKRRGGDAKRLFYGFALDGRQGRHS